MREAVLRSSRKFDYSKTIARDGDKKDVYVSILMVVTIELSQFTEVVFEESEDSSEQFEFVTSGSKEGGDNSTFLYDERYRITKPDFDE